MPSSGSSQGGSGRLTYLRIDQSIVNGLKGNCALSDLDRPKEGRTKNISSILRLKTALSVSKGWLVIKVLRLLKQFTKYEVVMDITKQAFAFSSQVSPSSSPVVTGSPSSISSCSSSPSSPSSSYSSSSFPSSSLLVRSRKAWLVF